MAVAVVVVAKGHVWVKLKSGGDNVLRACQRVSARQAGVDAERPSDALIDTVISYV